MGKTIDNIKLLKATLNDRLDNLLHLCTAPFKPPLSPRNLLESHVKIAKLLEEILFIEGQLYGGSGGPPKPPRTSPDTLAKFQQWATENGAELSNCTIWDFTADGYGVGIKATDPIQADSLVISVPQKLWMRSADIAANKPLKTLFDNDHILKSMSNVALAMFLLYEKFMGSSRWQPYIDILPRTYTTVMYFSMDDLQELWGSPVLEVALQQIKSIARQYAYFNKKFAWETDSISMMFRTKLTFDEYRWAVSTVMTRQNTVLMETEDTSSLIPLWDLCNHANGSISTVYNPELQRSECYALKDLQPNEQVFIFYGARNNDTHFIHNGFVVMDNKHDSIGIKLGISRADSTYDLKVQLLETLEMQTSGEFFINAGDNPITHELGAFLRVFNMNEDQLVSHFEDLTWIQAADNCHDLDKKSYQFLLTRLQLLLATYKTSMAADEALLLTIPKIINNENRILAVRLRITEKQLIHHTINYLNNQLKK